MKHDTALARYLSRYAEPEAALTATLPGRFGSAIVVPAFDESVAVLDLPQHVNARGGPTLFILVLNVPDNVDNGHCAARRTAALHQTLFNTCPASWQSGGVQPALSLHFASDNAAWLVVDRYWGDRRIARRAGVGLARKIGADIACALWQRGALADPWFCSTDADVVLPPDVLGFSRNEDASAQTLAFRHEWEGDAGTRQAAQLYDFYLRYSLWGLASAGSAYAHYSIGSTLVLNAHSYARVRGFPRRSAGEDFHLLSKLAKLSPVRCLSGPQVRIRARPSARVPFGTGPAIVNIRALADPLRDYTLPNPDVFVVLRTLIDAVPALFEPQLETAQHLRQCFGRQLGDALAGAALIHLEDAGIENAIRRARHSSRSRHRFSRHWHTWFDGLKTQRFLRAMNETAGGTSLQELLQHPAAPNIGADMHCLRNGDIEELASRMAQEAQVQADNQWRERFSPAL